MRINCSFTKFFAATISLTLTPFAALGGEDMSVEMENKIAASVTYNFARFVRPIDKDKASQRSAFGLCILSDSPGQIWDDLDGKSVGARAIDIRYFNAWNDAIQNCDFAYMDGSVDMDVSYRDLAKEGVVTLSRSKTFAQKGGGIQIDIQGAKVEFEVNEQALKMANQRISSKLMRVGMKLKMPTK